MGSRETHNEILQKVRSELESNYRSMSEKIKYYRPNGDVKGELDLVGYKPGILDIYEIKSEDKMFNKFKAEKQLDRARNHFGPKLDETIRTYMKLDGKPIEKYRGD